MAYVRRLAEAKARALLPQAQPQELVIGSDTSVILENDILGKPLNEADARLMLQRLRGCTHQVYTAIAVIRVSDGNLLEDVCITDVPMRAYSDEEIDRYIATGDPMDKAGAYGIQNPHFQPVASMAGCYASVMGLPLCHLAVLLSQFDLPPQAPLAENCQAALRYQCPIFHSILGNVGRN